MTNSDDKLYYSILASGSSGNATYLETAHHRILIDAGLSGKRLEERMQAIGRSLKDVEALFVTHEHSDHVQGVGVLARRYGMDVYANAKTWQAMAKKVGQIPLAQKNIIEPGKVKDFGDLEVESFAVSHDAACPQFYQMHHDNQTFCILTDTGYVSQRVAKTIENADAYLVESNHEIEILRAGPYPWSLKQRILGDKGHLSNDDGALVMADVLGDKTKRIYLGHLSKENNTKLHARMAMESTLKQKDLGVGEAFKVYDTDPDSASELFQI